MKSSIRKIGNSKGIILPQSFLKECFIEDEVCIEVKDNHIIISAPDDVKRKNWEQAFKEMAANGDDQLIIPDVFNDEEITDWKW
ncbi:MAG TPA: AbrB/MazE/SpoVT family DNA-binding domain-containing protein [Mucilaginibacter sp.]|jgi:antitoxin MazE